MSYEHINLLCMGCFSRLESGGTVCPYCGYDNAAQTVPTYQLPPRTILGGKYMLGKVLGEGGFGITYVAYDLNLDVVVAVKEYYPSGLVTRSTTESMTVRTYSGEHGDFFRKGRERFVDEAKRLARFRVLPGIVAVNDFLAENGTAYIVMEFVKGQTLKSYIAEKGGKLSPEQVFAMMEPVFSSLAQVHESGIMHRDISPDNIMVTPDGSVKLLDFGAAREFEDSGNKSLSVMLKHGYAPMEQYTSKGRQGPYTDVYALSATIYKALTGITPEGSMDRVMDDTVAPPSKLGVILLPHQEAALMKGLAVHQQYRYQTVTELHEALYGAQKAAFYGTQAEQAVQDDVVNSPSGAETTQQPKPLSGSGTPYAPYQPEAPLTEKSLRNIGIAALAVAAVLIVVVAIAIMLNQSDTPVEDYALSIDDADSENHLLLMPTPAPTPVPTPEPTPTPEATPEPKTISEAIFGSTDWFQLNIHWSDGRLTVFERDRNSPVWTMQGRAGIYRMVEPSFSNEPGGVLTIEFPTSRTIYRLYPNNTGDFGNETFIWDFETDTSYSRMSNSAANQTIGLSNALSGYLLLIIRVNWHNGDTTIFYKQDDGRWMMRGRNGSFSEVEPRFSSDSSIVYMAFPTTSTQYVFYENGSGIFGDEGFNWTYSFTDS